MMGGRTSEQWIAQYASSHQHPVNRFCHTVGIPLIVISIAWFAIAWLASASFAVAVSLFAVVWTLQFIGHALELYEADSMTHCATQKAVEVCFDTATRTSVPLPDDIRAKLMAMLAG